MSRVRTFSQQASNGEWAARRTREIEEWTNLFVIHPLSLAGARFFARFGVHPNAVSLSGMVCGVGAGVAYHHYDLLSGTLFGFGLMVGWHVLDGADGQVARLTGRSSELGKILDGFSDHVAFAAVYLGLATSLFPTMGWWAWLLAVGAGVSHFLQSTAYEFQRQAYDYWGRGKMASRPETPHAYEPRLARMSGVQRMFGRLHLAYLRVQRRVVVLDSQFEATLEKRLRAAPEEDPVRTLYRQANADLVRRWSILCSNYRTIAIFLACLLAQPVAFFLFEVVVLNAALLALSRMQRKRHRLLSDRLAVRPAEEVLAW